MISATTECDVADFRAHGTWRTLEKLATRIISDASAAAGKPFAPALGGGTRLMLALDHRISHDIDLFTHDAQWLGYLTPRLCSGAAAEAEEYQEDSAFVKLKFPQGEIDFIVTSTLLNLPLEQSPDTPFPLEPVAEVLAKKLFFRGAMMNPRDVFDWWSIENLQPGVIDAGAMGLLLSSRAQAIIAALDAISTSSRARRIWEDGILAPNKPDYAVTVAWAKLQLDAYLKAAPVHSRSTQ